MDDQLACAMEARFYGSCIIPEFRGRLSLSYRLGFFLIFFVHQIPGLVRFARHGALYIVFLATQQCRI